MGQKRNKKEKRFYENDNKKRERSNKKVWVHRLKAIGSFIISLVTVASSVATCITVWEMRNERNQAYKPYFIIEKAVYNGNFEKPFLNINDANFARPV